MDVATRVKASEMKIPLRDARRFHLFCSEHNPGTAEVAEELQMTCPAITYTFMTRVGKEEEAG
jgi:hypothetical protein